MGEMMLLILIVGSFVFGALIGAVLMAKRFEKLEMEEKDNEND